MEFFFFFFSWNFCAFYKMDFTRGNFVLTLLKKSFSGGTMKVMFFIEYVISVELTAMNQNHFTVNHLLSD